MAGTVILARMISPAEYGLLAMVLAVAGVADIFRDLGMSTSALRAPHISKAQQSNLFWINALAGLILSLVVFLVSWPLAAFYREPQLVPIVQAISPVYLLTSLSSQSRIVINRAMRFGTMSVIDIAAPLLGIGAALILAAQGYGVEALVAQQLVQACSILLLTVALAWWIPSLPSWRHDMDGLVAFGFKFALAQLVSYATRNVDSVMIGRVWGPAQLGLYDRAYQLAVSPLNQINMPMTRVALPVLSRVADDQARFADALRQAQLIACYGTSAVLFVAAGLARPLFDLLLGASWQAASLIFSVLAIGSIFRSVQQVANWALVAQGHAGSLLRLSLVGQPLVIACMAAGLAWGACGGGVVGSLGYALYWLLSLIWVRSKLTLRLGPLLVNVLRGVVFFGAPAGFFCFLIAWLAPFPPFYLLLTGLCVASGWFGVVTLIMPSVRADVRQLWTFARLAIGR